VPVLELLDVFREVGVATGYVVVGVLCLIGLVLSCLSLSGMWLAASLSGSEFPGLLTAIAFLVVSTSVELLEAVAGPWGYNDGEGRGGRRCSVSWRGSS